MESPKAELYIARKNGKLDPSPITGQPTNNFFAFIYLPDENKWVVFNNSIMPNITTSLELKHIENQGVPVDKIFSIHPESSLKTNFYTIN